MRKIILLTITFFTVIAASAQDFSNKGKDFWVGYGYHQVMAVNNVQDMVLYFATEQVTNITITIPATGYTQTLTTLPGNNVVTSATIPKNGANDARLLTEGLSNKGIHITSDKPMVAYAHVYNSSVSGATILFPTNTLGKEYYSVNYKNWSNSANSNCWFYVVATDTGTTTLEITPVGNTTGGWISGSTYTVTLTQGQIYNVMGSLISSPNNCNPVCTGYDLTGSFIKSVNTGNGCKKVAVFSGSGRISITCNNSNSSSDNYMVQAMPKTAWGKKYLTVPANGNQANNIYRICVSNPATIVKINGLVTTLPLLNGFYYEMAATNQPQLIEADSAIMVAQYFTSQGACGNGNPGDPEMIYLSSVEQNINKVLWNATPNFAITTHNFNVVLPNSGTAVSSFRLDGATVTGFVPHPQDPNYVYLKRNVSSGFHVIQSDSGFNAIAYGFGNAESYGYNAGTNIKDLYQQIGVQTTYGIETTPSVCTNSPFKFKVSLPYIPDSMHWNFNGAVGMLPNNNTVYIDNTGNVAEDSFTVVNGRTIHWYSVPLTYTFTTVGVYPITITTFVPNNDCGSVQDIDFDLSVSDPPTASFDAPAPGCYLLPVVATETTPQSPKATYKLWWEFFDPVTNTTTVYTTIPTNTYRTVSHTFTTPGVKRIRHASITTPGCLSDTIVQNITLPDLPNATISGNTAPICINAPVGPDVLFTGTLGTPEYIFTYRINFGAPIVSAPSVGGVLTIQAPTNVAGTFIYELLSVQNVGSGTCTRNISGQTVTVTITSDATVTLTSAVGTNNQTLCINNPITNITYAVGGSGTGASVVFTPALPGVTGSYAGGVFTITGTPTLNGVFNYTVSTTGPCIIPTATGTITVTDDATLALTSAPGTDNQALCINVPITNITYAVAGSGTGGSVSGLPAGVTGSYAGGVITITGTPSVSGTFNYTVNTTGPCIKPTATGTITVTADATLTLTSAVGTNNQTRCINTAITNITYAVGGSGTGGTVSGLPAGVTGTFAGGVVTITGTPTVAGTFNYTVTTTGPCVIPTASGTITVTDNVTITLTSATGTDNQALCINTPIVNITYSVGGSGTGGSVSGLPPGVTGSYSGGVITITGTPSVSGTFNYTVNTTGLCIIPTATGSITVTANATLTLTSAVGTDNQTRCINVPITNITYAVGGTGTGAGVSGLPAGVTGTFAGGILTITGAPTATGVFNYTVTTTGPCVIPTATGTITVTDNASVTLTSAPGTDNQTLCINTPIVNIIYLVAGSGTGGSVTGLPAGVTGTYAGGVITITGTPSVSGTFNYTVITTGPCVAPAATGTITVTANASVTLTSAVGTDNQTRCINVAITNITYAVGGSGTGGSVSGLPPGVTGVFAGGIITISGTPTVIGTFNYTVSTTGPCVIPTATGTITVNPDASISLTSAGPTTSQEVCRNSTITNITYSITGGGTGATVSGLPAGVTGVYASGVFTISGSPAVAGLFNYTVTTTGTCVQNSLSGTILVNQLPTASFTYTAPGCATRTISFADGSVANSGVLANWTWNFGDPGSGPLNTSTLQNPSHLYTAAGTYIVTLTVTTDKGCISNPIASVPVIINNRPAAGFIIPEVCLSDTYAQFTDTSTLANAAIDRWDWNFGDPGSGPLNVSNLQNPTHSYSAVGSYSVRLIVWNFALGCRDTITQSLFVNGSFPIANFTVNNPTTLCANDSVAIVEASTVFPGVITKVEIYWDNAGFPAVFQTDNFPFTGKVYRHLYPNFQTPLTRIFTIRYRAYSGGVCVNDRIANITVNAAPLVQFNNMPATCLLVPPFQITQASETGGVPGTGVYSGPGVSPTGIFSPQSVGIGTYTILYTYTSTAGGCVDTMSNTITVLDTAHAAFSYVLPACQQVPVSFTDLSTAPPTVVLNNTVWDFGDGSPVENHAPGSTFTHVFTTPGTFTVTMHNVSAYGCLSTTTSASITIDPNHTISLASANNIQTRCINNAIANITYNLGGGATGATVSNLPPGVTYSVAGNILTITGAPTSSLNSPYNFIIQTTGNSCVIAQAIGTITVDPDHTISRIVTSGDSAQSVCVNTAIDPIIYDLGGGATSASASGLPPGVTGVATGGNTFTISGTPTSSAGSPYNFTIQTAGNACVKANTIGEIKVNPYPVPDFTFDKGSYCIPDATVGFINNTTPAPLSNYTYDWAFGDGGVSNAVAPTHLYTSTGPFTVVLKARSTVVLNGGVIGCESIKTNLLDIIHPQPKADFVFNKPSVCIGDNVTITDNTDGKDGIVNQWHWDMGDGSIRTTNPVTYTYSDIITYTITMYSVNSYNCKSDIVTKPFAVYPYPHVNAGPDKAVLEGGSVELEAVIFANDPQYSWTPALYLTDSRIARPRVADPKTDMTYRLTVTARGGCALSDNVFVKLLKFPVIPNTFTPNNDGINDKWRIDYLNTYPDNRVQIFTRNGNLVFESRGYNTPWDGTLKGKPLPFDTYYYIIEPGNGRDPITGYITILK